MSILLLMGVASVLTWLQAHQAEAHHRAMADGLKELFDAYSSAASRDAYSKSPLGQKIDRWRRETIIGAPAGSNAVWLWYCGVVLLYEAAVTFSWNGEPFFGYMLPVDALSNFTSVCYAFFVICLVIMVGWIGQNARSQEKQLAELRRDAEEVKRWGEYFSNTSTA